jgi:hypothetical protein
MFAWLAVGLNLPLRGENLGTPYTWVLACFLDIPRCFRFLSPLPFSLALLSLHQTTYNVHLTKSPIFCLYIHSFCYVQSILRIIHPYMLSGDGYR